MTTDEQLRDALEKWREGVRQAQLRWVTVDTVDKDNGTMDVTGVIDRLEYYDVQLGMGALCIYPKPGTTCLVGIEHPEGHAPDIPSATQWTSAIDLANRRLYYKTSYNNSIRCIDLKKIDFARIGYQAHPLDTIQQQPIEELSIS